MPESSSIFLWHGTPSRAPDRGVPRGVRRGFLCGVRRDVRAAISNTVPSRQLLLAVLATVTVFGFGFVASQRVCDAATPDNAPLQATVLTGPAESDVWLLDDFESLQNRCGGFRNAFSRAPSTAVASRRTELDSSNRCFRISAERAPSGYCGVWLHLFDFRANEHDAVDATDWPFLSLKIRGEHGGEQVRLRIADAQWHAREDALNLGFLPRYLPAGLTTDWQEIVVPIWGVTGLDRRRLKSISFEFPDPGRATIFIDDVCLKRTSDALVSTGSTNSRIVPTKPRPRALWIWTTDSIPGNASEVEALFDACRSDGIRTLWIQLPYRLVRGSSGRQAKPDCRINRVSELRQFLKRAHAEGLQIHALDGSPEFAVQSGHGAALAVLDAVLEFNNGATANERFDGVHFDNEPYLLLAWSDPVRRERIVRELLSLSVECQRRCTAAGIEFGVDLPFWWHERAAGSHESATEITYQGQRKPVTFHLIDQLDNVGIMNYRDQADGADGMLAHGAGILEYADSVPGARILMGIETFRYPPQRVWLLDGLSTAEFTAALNREPAAALLHHSRLNGLRLFRCETGESIHLGVGLPPDDPNGESPIVCETLQQLSRAFPAGGVSRLGEIQERLAEGRDPEWTGFELRPLPHPETGQDIPAFISTRLMLSKVTFADDSIEDVNSETHFADTEWQSHPSYEGIAIHSWSAYRKLRGDGSNSNESLRTDGNQQSATTK